MNKYDENKVLRNVARVARIEGNNIIFNADTIIGIHMWGKLDYLVNYCGYIVSRYNRIIKVKDKEPSCKEDKRSKNYGQLHRKDRK